MGRIEIFQASTLIRSSGRVPELDQRQIDAARRRFLAAIRAEATPTRSVDEPAA